MACERKPRALANYSAYEVAEEERRLGVSTKLKLYTDPFDVKKELKTSDVNGLSRLMLPTNIVQKRILAKWDKKLVEQANSLEGIRVCVVDMDTMSEHPLTLKRWRSSNSYVLTSNWVSSFVQRRELKEGDEINLFWCQFNCKFYFCVTPQFYRRVRFDNTLLLGKFNDVAKNYLNL